MAKTERVVDVTVEAYPDQDKAIVTFISSSAKTFSTSSEWEMKRRIVNFKMEIPPSIVNIVIQEMKDNQLSYSFKLGKSVPEEMILGN